MGGSLLFLSARFGKACGRFGKIEQIPGAAKSSQGQPGAARSSQGQPGAALAARSSQEQPGAVVAVAAAVEAAAVAGVAARPAGQANYQSKLCPLRPFRRVWGYMFFVVAPLQLAIFVD